METTWETLIASATPRNNAETSPTGSLLSDPGSATPTDSSAAATQLIVSADDMDMVLKGPSFQSSLASVAEEGDSISDALQEASQATVDADAAASDKKQTKKRKSWGQILPEPKTNLPPRKRAKTEDEKEQRRVERVLRNRRAAQSSRERKRLEVEALEIRNRELEEQLAKVRRENMLLYERLTQVQGKSAVVSTANPPVTLSQELFRSQNGHSFVSESDAALGPFLSSGTIDPVSLSPALPPVPDANGDEETIPEDKLASSEQTSNTTEQQQRIAQAPGEQERSEPAASSARVSVGGGASSVDRPSELASVDGGFVLPDDFASHALFHGDFNLLSAGDPDRFVLESGYLDSPESGNSDFHYLADHDPVSAVHGPEFDIEDFLNADGAHQPSKGDFFFGDGGLDAAGPGVHHSAAQDASEDPDQQPHAGASY
ncbi:hypothetical protein SPBR_05884 [Sporothrix brasiliensis 5110]|uniref:BZIP domain-containing protein n=1 Tax=Sporothrix brasiliensis 5110 TaxID=1398154 RepID=A0A0C2F596_9PEZI|nr:uncharacterized protein SPBR_05884 [Sporothrix brasiliensis 5110]KIH94084.1 hypothetical protein SPBR_05884 [Sporothrix brasiliensis 5110]